MTRTGIDASRREPRGVLAIRSFRRLWVALSLSSVGDWLSILALTALASALTAPSGYQAQSFAVGGVLVARILPVVLLGTVGGAIADRFDRRQAMVVADFLRFAIVLSVPLVGRLEWLLAATFIVGFLALFWTPAQDAALPYLVPKDRLERAYRLGARTVYGSAPVAAGLFAVLSLGSGALGAAVPFFRERPNDLVFYVSAALFVISALAVATMREIPPKSQTQNQRISVPSLFRQIIDGRRTVGGARSARRLVGSMLGAFAATGAVVGVAKIYVSALGGGDAGYGVVVGTLFLGGAYGMFLGPRILRGFSRRRLFGLAVVGVGLTLALVALVQNLVLVALLTGVLGAAVGIAWVTGRTVVELDLDDAARAHATGYLRSLVHVEALVVLAVAAVAAGLIGQHPVKVGQSAVYHLDGANAVMLVAALYAVVVGIVAYRRMDDKRGIPLFRDLGGALSGKPYVPEGPQTESGLFIAFEGGEGAGKSTQARLLAIWLRDHGYDVVSTQEPGATKVGMRLRAILLDTQHKGLSSRAEALLYAADRAEHVASVIKPALDRRAVVITDRYIDSSLAYQGAGRVLSVGDVARVNQWATGNLIPDLTVILDVPADVGLGRFATPADRIESEPLEFHERVRRGFLRLAETQPHRYVVIDGTRPQTDITKEIQRRVLTILPDPIPVAAEEVTTTMPAIKD
jgi:dTMP kinase